MRRTLNDIVKKARSHPLATVVAGLALGLVAAALALTAFAGLADEVFEGETHRLDLVILLRIHALSPAWFGEPMRLITALGYYWVVVPLALISGVAFYVRGLKFSAALLLISTAGSAALTTLLKAIFQRTRPEVFQSGYDASYFSFPSGHATVAVGFYGTLVMLAAWRLSGLKRWTLVAAGVISVLLIGFSRLYLGVHYPTDVLAGYLTAAIWVSTVGTVLFLWRSVLVHRKRLASKDGHRPP